MNLKLEDAEYELDQTEIVIATLRGIKLRALPLWKQGQYTMYFAVSHREHNYSVTPAVKQFDVLNDAVSYFNQLVDRSQERVLD